MDIKDMPVIYKQVKPITQKSNTIMNKEIAKTAEKFQKIARQIKELEAKKEPLKEALLQYASEHKKEFDQAFQMKFPNGTYISQRVKECIEATDTDKGRILETYPEFRLIQLDEQALIEDYHKNTRLRKFLKKLGVKVGQKESLAVYAS